MCSQNIMVSSHLFVWGHVMQSFKSGNILCCLFSGNSTRVTAKALPHTVYTRLLSLRRGWGHPRCHHWGHPYRYTHLFHHESFVEEFYFDVSTQRDRILHAHVVGTVPLADAIIDRGGVDLHFQLMDFKHWSCDQNANRREDCTHFIL